MDAKKVCEELLGFKSPTSSSASSTSAFSPITTESEKDGFFRFAPNEGHKKKKKNHTELTQLSYGGKEKDGFVKSFIKATSTFGIVLLALLSTQAKLSS